MRPKSCQIKALVSEVRVTESKTCRQHYPSLQGIAEVDYVYGGGGGGGGGADSSDSVRGGLAPTTG